MTETESTTPSPSLRNKSEILRLKVLPGKSDALQLVVTFGLIGTERSWLNL